MIPKKKQDNLIDNIQVNRVNSKTVHHIGKRIFVF